MSEYRETESSRLVLVVTDAGGEIVSTAAVGREGSAAASSTDVQSSAGLGALPGQVVHVLAMPDDYLRLTTAIERHTWLSRYRVVGGQSPRLVERYRQ